MDFGGEAYRGSQPIRFGELNKLLPVVFVVLTVLFLYVEYVFLHASRLLQLELPLVYRRRAEVTRAQVELLIFHTLTGMMLYCLVRCILTFPGTIPDGAGWDLHADTADGSTAVSLIEKKQTGERRHCKWCLKFKPDRCHHCRVCNICVLRMDHHCPWVYNCIGFQNYKFFFLLLVYAAADLIFITLTMFDSLWWSTRIDVSICVMMALAVGETYAAFLTVVLVLFLGFHTWLMLKAITTVEFCEKSMKKDSYDSSIYSQGWFLNICAVLGQRPSLWLLPISHPTGDGLTWGNSRGRTSGNGGITSDETPVEPVGNSSSGPDDSRASADAGSDATAATRPLFHGS
eukprot:TRINITY_DN61884_c0_g1_i1.p1 TRINITY_DN61884_c0_g1~~TRINITY_DN61884_c0_g1_i1.p1  ORF type:complete len:345 (+),score=35.24 TRINITY_DN61884_c0_g1_i1:71-1105(+)